MNDLKSVRDLTEELSLISLIYTRDDAEGMQIGHNFDKGEEIYPELTDDEWEIIRHKWDKCNSHIMGDCWDLLESLVREAVNGRKETDGKD